MAEANISLYSFLLGLIDMKLKLRNGVFEVYMSCMLL